MTFAKVSVITFSKVIVLVYVLCKGTMQKTFKNLCLDVVAMANEGLETVGDVGCVEHHVVALDHLVHSFVAHLGEGRTLEAEGGAKELPMLHFERFYLHGQRHENKEYEAHRQGVHHGRLGDHSQKSGP